MKSIVFKCRKCYCELHVPENKLSVGLLDKLSENDCPECGEEGYENWILIGVREELPEDSEEQE